MRRTRTRIEEGPGASFYRRPAWQLVLTSGLLLALAVVAQRPCMAQGVPGAAGPAALSTLERVFVRRFAFEGNTAIATEDLQAVVAPYEHRELTMEELQEVREKVSRYYVDAGYVNSGALLPDQEVVDGVVTLRIVEGELTDVRVSTDGRLHERYISARLQPSSPLNLDDLRWRLQLLQRDPRIEKVDADLGAGAAPGEAILRVDVHENRPYFASLQFDNYRPPSIDSERLLLSLGHRNVTGFGDTFGAQIDLLRVEDSHLLAYTLPLTPQDTVLALELERSDAEVQTALFDILDIKSEFKRWSIGLEHPLYRSRDLRRALDVSLKLDVRQTKTFLLGERFSFSPGARDGKATAAVLKFAQQWTMQDDRQVLAARSSFHFGLDAFGATRNEGPLPDSEYIAWIGQLQWLRRLELLDSRLLLRAILQVTNDWLLSSEKFSLGGHDTVRGYRENLLTRDKAFVGSVEWRVPVGNVRIPYLSTGLDDGRVELAAFFDYGRGWNAVIATPGPKDISSLGVGLRWSPSPRVSGALYWGHTLRNVDLPDEDDDLQDDGLQFQVNIELL